MFNSVLSPVPSSDHERESKKSEYAMRRSWGSVMCVCLCVCLKKNKIKNGACVLISILKRYFLDGPEEP